MQYFEINSFFTTNGLPAIQLGVGDWINYPIIRIWEFDGNVYTLIVGQPNGTSQNTDGIMTPQSDGFYSFLFTDTLGYDSTKKYLVRVDGGSSVDDEYQSGIINPSITDISQVGEQVWNTSLSGVSTGSAGDIINQLSQSLNNVTIALNDINSLINTCIKYQTNKTKIDLNAKTLTVYDNDNTTALVTFNLLDQFGNPSTDSVTERVPQ
jgi:hypothetical protein